MMDSLHAVILAGGKGERFWPLSKPETPKPFLQFFSDRSLLQQTFDRAQEFVPAERIYVIVGEQHEALSRNQLPQLDQSRLLLEPAGRDTAAAIGYASLHLPENALMLVLPADHLIPDTASFVRTMSSAATFVQEHGGPCTFGIKPDRPDSNYGYIEATGQNLGSTELPVYPVRIFIEKPELQRAEEFIRMPYYYWNSGMFLWKVSRIRELIAKHLPELWSGLQQVFSAKGKSSFRQLYQSLPRISIDYGVMQKADRVVVVPAPFAWDDIGTWNSLLRILPADRWGNLVRGASAGIDTSDCVIYAESHTIATAGVHDLVIVQSGDQILVCSREYASRLKELLGKLPS
jgi:mannose-1-phosphate guanylyltransferase